MREPDAKGAIPREAIGEATVVVPPARRYQLHAEAENVLGDQGDV
jgi:hypothetical protein